MNRFDPNFHDCDPITRRPFSWGHPDGVWIIAIFLGIPTAIAAVCVVLGIALLFLGKNWAGAQVLLGSVGALSLFVPPIRFLFRRSRYALYWVLASIAIFVVVLVAGILWPNEAPMKLQIELIGGGGIVLFSTFAIYLFGLKRDHLLL